MSKSNKPVINISPIANLKSLASMLSLTEEQLLHLKENIELYYKPGKVLEKKNGEPRITHDAKPSLKQVHERIKNRILKKVTYPEYMMGGIADIELPRSCYAHASLHKHKTILITEDIADFFPSTEKSVVKKIWQHLFHFSPEVAETLAHLTTYKNQLPQGWKTSGYIANLAFWSVEPQLVEFLVSKGLTYSRFMDDITISSSSHLSKEDQSKIVSKVFGVLGSQGFQAKREKHKIMGSGSKMRVTGLGVNSKRLTLSSKERNQIRAQVFQLEKRYKTEGKTERFCKDWRSASARVSRYKKLHPKPGVHLKFRLDKIKPPKEMLNPKNNKRNK